MGQSADLQVQNYSFYKIYSQIPLRVNCAPLGIKYPSMIEYKESKYYCSECKEDVIEYEKICSNCGADLTKTIDKRSIITKVQENIVDNKGKLLIVSFVVLLLSIIIGYFERGTFEHQVLTLIITVYLNAIIILISIVLFIFKKYFYSIIGIILIIGTQLQYVAGTIFMQIDINNAIEYGNELVAKIEKYRNDNGNFPASIPNMEKINYGNNIILKQGFIYSSFDSTYRLELIDPSTIFGGWTYNRENKQWHKWVD